MCCVGWMGCDMLCGIGAVWGPGEIKDVIRGN